MCNGERARECFTSLAVVRRGEERVSADDGTGTGEIRRQAAKQQVLPATHQHTRDVYVGRKLSKTLLGGGRESLEAERMKPDRNIHR